MNHSLELLRPQELTVLNRQEILNIREEVFSIAETLTNNQILTHMGILNSLLWRAGTDYDAIYKDGDKYRVKPDQWENLLRCSAAGEVAIAVPIDFTEKYLINNWPKAYHSNVTLRKCRAQQLEWGLFYFDIENRPKGGKSGEGVATPPRLEQFNVAKALIFYQMFDQIRRSRINENLRDLSPFDFMPKHGGMLCVEMYNALFFGISTFSGAGVDNLDIGNLDIVIEDAETLPSWRVVIFKWRERKCVPGKEKNYLPRSMWECIVRRAGVLFNRALTIVEEIISEPLGELVEVPF